MYKMKILISYILIGMCMLSLIVGCSKYNPSTDICNKWETCSKFDYNKCNVDMSICECIEWKDWVEPPIEELQNQGFKYRCTEWEKK